MSLKRDGKRNQNCKNVQHKPATGFVGLPQTLHLNSEKRHAEADRLRLLPGDSGGLPWLTRSAASTKTEITFGHLEFSAVNRETRRADTKFAPMWKKV
jgi:hypothetical protein